MKVAPVLLGIPAFRFSRPGLVAPCNFFLHRDPGFGRKKRQIKELLLQQRCNKNIIPIG